MTFLEKAMEINKSEGKILTKSAIIDYSCPSDYELEEVRNCGTEVPYSRCKKCWNREMPNTEAKNELVRDFDCELDMAYDRGLNDAWELAKKIILVKGRGGFDAELNLKLFGTISCADIIQNFTPQEALAKLKAYEEAQIEVGDVVDVANGTLAIVTYANHVIDNYSFVDFTGTTRNDYKSSMLKKTGKHLDISSILKQIGE
jgi:hypothetical protein